MSMERYRDSPIVQTVAGAFCVVLGGVLAVLCGAALLVGFAVLLREVAEVMS